MLETGHKWPEVVADLRARLETAERGGTETRVIELGGSAALVLVAGEDEASVETVMREHVDPWLAGLPLVGPSQIEAGRAVLHLRPADGTSDLAGMNEDERLAHFVSAVAHAELVWGLYGDSWARAEPQGDGQVLPFWPTAELAARCIDGPWASFAPRSIELDAFVEQWLTGMVEDGIVAAIMPTPSTTGTIVPAAKLLEALRDAQPGDNP